MHHSTLNRLLALVCYATFALLNADQGYSADQSSQLLTNAWEVLSLSADQASLGIPISIRGVVTAAEPNWGGRFFVQDSSGGVFVENISNMQPAPGDEIAVSGISYPGGYAPIVSKPRWEKVGTAPLPRPKSVAIEQLMSGAEDGQRVEISGIVRSAQIRDGLLEAELVSGGYRIHVYAPAPPDIDPETMVGSQVRVRGTAAASYNAPLRHFVTVAIYVPAAGDEIVEKSGGADPFQAPLTPVNSIAQYRVGLSLGDRVHVKGVVTCQRPGEDAFIRDDSGGLQIKCNQAPPLAPGDIVDVVGFPGVENFLPVLEDAIIKKTSDSPAEVTPKSVSIEELLEGLHHADYITLRGKLLDRLTKGNQPPLGESDAAKTILVLQTTNLLFTAERASVAPDSQLATVPIGSLIEVDGICYLQSSEDGKIKSIQILLPMPNSFRVVAKPSWLTPRHLSIILGIALAVIIAATSWIIMVSRRNSALRHLIHERELDQMELQKAHDTLEWRVKERTQQLKFQITARKEAEVQFKAVLTERTRLAKELHDTLEQTLTGITLQLNTVAKLFEQNPPAASHHLGLVRNMVRMSRVDLRRSIWDLRSRELEEFDLSRALSVSATQIAESAGIHVQIETSGQVRPLPEVIEENLLRIGQEAVTNAVKHSGAGLVKIALEFGITSVVLSVQDDGTGFTPGNCVGPNDGHFGLLGMSERAKRLGGQLVITSSPGKGTLIRAELPTEQVQAPTQAGEQTDHEADITDSNSGC